MSRWGWTAILILLLSITGGCKQKEVSDEDAIRASIEKHLSETQGLNLSAMDKNVRQISIIGDHANVRVEFRLKQGDARMEIEYAMQKQVGDWKVLSSTPVAGPGAQPGMPPPGAPSGGTP
jgi:hypothetical protein